MNLNAKQQALRIAPRITDQLHNGKDAPRYLWRIPAVELRGAYRVTDSDQGAGYWRLVGCYKVPDFREIIEDVTDDLTNFPIV